MFNFCIITPFLTQKYDFGVLTGLLRDLNRCYLALSEVLYTFDHRESFSKFNVGKRQGRDKHLKVIYQMSNEVQVGHVSIVDL